jgi:hypothetical protein
LDILVDVGPFHLHAFNLEMCSLFCLHVLVKGVCAARV